MNNPIRDRSAVDNTENPNIIKVAYIPTTLPGSAIRPGFEIREIHRNIKQIAELVGGILENIPHSKGRSYPILAYFSPNASHPRCFNNEIGMKILRGMGYTYQIVLSKVI